MRLRHVCEVCGREELLTPEEAYQQGWDYPPKMGAFGVVSPRTCGSCGIQGTLWWFLAVDKGNPDDMSESQRETLLRILCEPKSVVVDNTQEDSN